MAASSIPDKVEEFFSLPNPTSRNDPGANRPLSEMSTRNPRKVKGRQEFKAHNLTVICVYKMWEPRSLTTYASPPPVTRIDLHLF
jgi:hypothetical protein